ncbi:hypothetical protein [Paenibacillus sp.]
MIAEHDVLVSLVPVVVQLAVDADGGLVIVEAQTGEIVTQLLGGVVHHHVEQLASGQLKGVFHVMQFHKLQVGS